MLRMRWLRGGRSARGTPSIRRALRRHPFLLPLLTLVILSQAGCQSGFFGPCGPCANSPLRRFRERLFNRDPGCCGGGTVVSDVPIIEGSPPTVVAPAPVVTPGTGTTLPAPTEVSPQIEPIPSATPGPPPSSSSSGGTQGAQAPSGKSSYEAARPNPRLGRLRSSNASRNYAMRAPVPTYRSARGAPPAPPPVGAGTKAPDSRPAELSLLDNLPPLDLPHDGGRPEIRTVAGPSSDLEAKPATAPTPVESSPTEPTQAPAAAAPPAPDEVGAAPGLRRFAVLEPKLAGGSLPTADGLDWLAEKGYKTLIDLRDTSEVQSSFLAEVSRRGLRYISLPITLTSVDRDHVARFHFEISLADARPIYFFDSEGNRAGMLWYIQRMTEKNDSYDPQEASRQAEELGLAAPEFREAARRYLEDAKPRPPAPAAAAAPEQATVPTTTATPPAKPTLASEADPEPGPTPPLPGETGIPARPELLAGPKGEAGIPAKPEALRDPNAWRPIVALLLTVMGIPAAYWSRSLIAFRVRSRASLPGPARRLRSLPAGSGE